MQRTVIAFLISAVATAAVAGEGNEANFIQTSPLGAPIGNKLTIDQGGASGSLVTGIGSDLVGSIPAYFLNAVSGADPLLATQRGEGNVATIELTGPGGELQLLQSNDPSATWAPGEAGGYNVADVEASAGALGGIIQIGELNQASMSLADDARGLITQLGSSLSATLNVQAGGSGTILQAGNNSTVGTVNVLSDNSLTYVQIGNNLTPSSPVTVYSTTPGNIYITQTGL